MPRNEKRLMDETKNNLKVCCETTFWSYLNGGRTPLSHVAVKQAFTRQWWQDIAPSWKFLKGSANEQDCSHISQRSAGGRLFLGVGNGRNRTAGDRVSTCPRFMVGGTQRRTLSRHGSLRSKVCGLDANALRQSQIVETENERTRPIDS